MSWQSPALAKILRLAILCCFAGHGTLAIMNAGVFTSEWSTWVQSLFPDAYKYEMAKVMLLTVGVIDILAAACFLLPNIPLAAFTWVIVWGAATGTSRLFFLSSLENDFWYFQVRPISEFLIRVPNWMTGFMLLMALYPQFTPAKLREKPVDFYLWIIALTQVAGLSLHYIVELNDPFLLPELEKKMMPLWYLHLTGFLAVASLLGCLTLPLIRPKSAIFPALTSCTAVLAFISVDLFKALVINAPQGFFFSGIRVIDAMPIYVCLITLAMITIQAPRSGLKENISTS